MICMGKYIKSPAMTSLEDNLIQLQEQMSDIKSSLDKISNQDKYTFFHGCGENHTFWVHPISYSLINKWNTHLTADTYCNNNVSDGCLNIKDTFEQVSLYQYKCVGHTTLDDFKEAEEEWIRKNIIYPAEGIHREIRNVRDIKSSKETQTDMYEDETYNKTIYSKDDSNFKNDMIASTIITFIIIVMAILRGGEFGLGVGIGFEPMPVQTRELILSSRELISQ